MTSAVVERAEGVTDDTAGIYAAAEDYIEGWYQGDPARTQRALHPQMAKRLIAADPTSGVNTVQHMDTATLVSYVERRVGQPAPDVQIKDITILSVYGDIATVRAEMNDWVDFLHLGRFADGWRIVNVIWALKPKAGAS